MNEKLSQDDVLHQPISLHLYLDLMKRCLTDTIFFDDPLANYKEYRLKRQTLWKRFLMSRLMASLRHRNLKLVEPSTPWLANYADLTAQQLGEMRENGEYWPARAHTMIGMKRLDNIQYCVEAVLNDRIPGDLIETGVWRGGACIFMRAILKAYNDSVRRVWVADSFGGLPRPNDTKYEADAGAQFHTWSDYLAVPKSEVARNFSR